MARRITLYSKPDCHLCEEARADLRTLETELGLEVIEVDITGDPALYRRFQYLIPVIDIDGGVALFAPIDLVELRHALAEVKRKT
ncbi:MAG: glutaredoxin family protein [Anaerolineae bacterium]|nr:glutaredoxin family protein [Anaerolineae bacterium]